MTNVKIEERINAPAKDVWECLFDPELVIGVYAETVDIKGSGEGAIRTSKLLGDNGTIVERIDVFDEQNWLCRYSVIDRGPMPFKDYTGLIKITPTGQNSCIVKLEGNFVAIGMSEQESIDLYMQNNHTALCKVKKMLPAKP